MGVRRWVAKGLAGAVVLTTLAGGVRAQGNVTQPPAAPKLAAVVRGEPILLSDVDAVLKSHPLPTEPTALQRKQMQMETLGMMIDELLMRQFVRKNGPPIDPNQVNKHLADLTEELKKKGHTLQDFLRENNQTEAELRAEMQNMLQWAEYVKVNVHEPDVHRYYDENRDFFDKVTVRVSHIVIRVSPTAPVSERDTARAKLLALRQDIVASKIEFGEAAKKHSQCTSAPAGGDIGYIARRYMVEENLARTAFSLKVGEVSDVVQTDYGLHLVKVTDRKPGQPSEYAKIKDDVREIYIEELMHSIVAQERKRAETEGQIQINLQ
jgi:peptidyl-prolyl cis-trans isomerase C